MDADHDARQGGDVPVELTHDSLQAAAHDHLLLHFSRNGAFGPDGAELLVLERGEGPYVFDTKGRRYIDALSILFCCPARLQLRRRVRRGRAASSSTAGVRHQLVDCAPALNPLAARSRRARAGRARQGLLHLRRLGSPSRRSGRSCACTTSPTASRSGEGDCARTSPTTASRSGRSRSPASRLSRTPFAPRADPRHARVDTNAFPGALRRRRGGVCRSPARREWRQTIVAEGPETVAMIIAEPM